MREFAVFFRKCPKTFVQDCKSVDRGRSMLFSILQEHMRQPDMLCLPTIVFINPGRIDSREKLFP